MVDVKRIEISGQTGDCVISIGERLENLSSYLPDTRFFIVTDRNVYKLYGDRFPDAETIKIGCGEQVKTLETVSMIYERLVSLEADRSSFLVGIGGGIVCDITGFVASTYMRGIGFGYVATTLLAQVDASAGGKTGVNFLGYKNMVGTFCQPRFVICDPYLLSTLPPRERACGFAEIIKHALIADFDAFVFLEKNCRHVLNLSPEIMCGIIHDSVSIKAAIVNIDEKEKGKRRLLNFGHTIGHAIEKTTGLGHGEAVSIGMAAAARISARHGYISDSDAARIESLLSAYGLPVVFDIDSSAVIDAVLHDKKREGDHIHFVLLESIGHAFVKPISIESLAETIMHMSG